MPDAQLTYNPGVLGDDQLVRAFVVRKESLELVLEALRDNAASQGVNRHMLIVGPRGSGKTMIARRVAAEIRLNPEYGAQWFPLVFGEESYPVGTAGEFWLEALFHLADQTKASRWEQTFRDLRDEPDDARLRERALAQLLDFADGVGKRLLLVVENLNMLVAEQMDEHAAWDLRHTLMNERRLMLLGTATSHFDEITNTGRAWFEMFSIHDLRPLGLEECGVLWQAVTAKPLGAGPLRGVRILTGGNPRLLTILASFAANRSFRELMEQLVHLIDDHTEYFKSHLDALPAKERKVLVALLEHWDPVGAAELARISRLKINETSTMLGRLVGRGAVEVAEQQGRKKLYQVAERLFNIYYLMRRRGEPAGRVRAAVSFMVMFYEADELATTAAELAREACGLPPGAREDFFLAYTELVKLVADLAPRIIERTPQEFFAAEDAPDSIRRLPHGRALDEAAELRQAGQLAEAEARYRRVLAEDPRNARAWSGLAVLLAASERLPQAVDAARKAVEIAPEVDRYWVDLGLLLPGVAPPAEAERFWRAAVQRHPQLQYYVGVILLLRQAQGADEAAIVREAEEWLDRSHRDLSVLLGLAVLGTWKGFGKGFEQAETWAREAHAKAPILPVAALLSDVLAARGKWDEALEVSRSLLDAAGTDDRARDGATDLLIRAAAHGLEREALDVLVNSKGAAALEPLAVGLRIHAGETPLVAKEILEIGQDVAERIRSYERK